MKVARLLLTLVIGGILLCACTIPTTPPPVITTPTPAASQPMDLIGVWSGTHVESGPGFALYFNMVMNVTGQYGTQVWGQLTANGTRAEGNGLLSAGSFQMPMIGNVSGSTLTWLDQHVQVSGNSMTGSGTYTNSTRDWSYNLTRVR